jgi:hypothetical protein
MMQTNGAQQDMEGNVAVTTNGTRTAALTTDMAAVDHVLAVHRAVDRHVQSEFTNDIDNVMSTIIRDAPLAFSMRPRTSQARLAGISTAPGVRAHYEAMRQVVEVVSWQPFTSIRRDWYVFENGMTTYRDNASGTPFSVNAVVLFPADHTGIHGELGWPIHQGAKATDRQSADDPAPQPNVRAENHRLHLRLVEALGGGDLDTISSMLEPDAVITMRDYAHDGPYEAKEGRDAVVGYFADFFATFDVSRVDILNAVIGDWFLFSELHWTATVRRGPQAGTPVRFCTAAMWPLMESGLITTVMGYGTDPVKA